MSVLTFKTLQLSLLILLSLRQRPPRSSSAPLLNTGLNFGTSGPWAGYFSLFLAPGLQSRVAAGTLLTSVLHPVPMRMGTWPILHPSQIHSLATGSPTIVWFWFCLFFIFTIKNFSVNFLQYHFTIQKIFQLIFTIRFFQSVNFQLPCKLGPSHPPKNRNFHL